MQGLSRVMTVTLSTSPLLSVERCVVVGEEPRRRRGVGGRGESGLAPSRRLRPLQAVRCRSDRTAGRAEHETLLNLIDAPARGRFGRGGEHVHLAALIGLAKHFLARRLGAVIAARRHSARATGQNSPGA
jgi:hypothetical protein